MKTSESIKEKIKQWEGLRTEAYLCPAGVLTIGYGHTGPDVTKGMKISAGKASELLSADIAKFELQVDRLLGNTKVSRNQFDALVSFAFNVGVGNLSKSTLLRKVKANPADRSISGEFHRWVYAGGRMLPGLLARRRAEAEHYFSDNAI